MSIHSHILSPHEWAAHYRRDDGEQQPISAVEREFGTESHGKKHGLELIRAIVDAWGQPQLKYPTVHVTGSKGKGSTVAILSSILRAAGYRVGSYTSPSLTHFGERIQVAGQPMTDVETEECVAELQRLLPLLPDRPRFFEAATAIAFRHFERRRVDGAVVEVGLGGRLDATNVVMPEVAIITTIELEHTQILGDTLGEIALEKAGIIKPGVPTITAIAEREAFEPVQRICAERGSTLYRLDRDFRVSGVRCDRTAQRFDLDLGPLEDGTYLTDLSLSLAGEAQSANAALAVAAAWLVRGRFPRISEAAIREGLHCARWPGRLELIAHCPAVLLDVAHTPASAHELRSYLDRFFANTPKTLVIGMLRDKKYWQVAAELVDSFDSVIVAPVKWFRSMVPEDLQAAFRVQHDSVEVASSICAGMERALEMTPASGLVVVAGSLFAVGEVKRKYGW